MNTTQKVKQKTIMTLMIKPACQKASYEMSRYRWNILGLCQVRSWKNFGETSTQEGHKLYFSGKELEGKHEQGVGFLDHKDIVNTVMGCRPVSNKLITIRLRASPFNITII